MTVEAFQGDEGGIIDEGDMNVILVEQRTQGSKNFMLPALEMEARQAALREAT